MINGEDMRCMRLEQKRQMNGIFCVFVAIAYKKIRTRRFGILFTNFIPLRNILIKFSLDNLVCQSFQKQYRQLCGHFCRGLFKSSVLQDRQ